ncbi:TolC family protein [Hymenobacter sp. RP-2-7]|uniref:TolC family protein n=1 Tax=Hymenobacter polaris TaxID=2682546 RepID=A0A7Y0FLG3_9BACT|nr:TolC family protein [Hymenobacter polaris]NML64364.1 TolC family protein [Hymenobacter polaris]
MRVFRLFLVGWLGLPLAGWGQGAAPLTLPQALQLARTNYPALRARQAGVAAAAADVRTVRANYLPQLTAQAQALDGTSNQARGALLGGVGPNVSGVRDYTSYQASWASQGMLYIDWPAVTFGRYRADVQRAEASVSEAQAAYDQELFTHQVQVADAYLLALAAQKTVALQAANLQRSLALRRIVLAGTRAGIQAGIDSSTANAEAARARLQVLASRQQAEQQRVRLAGLLGVPTQSFTLTDSTRFFTRLPALPAAADTGSLLRHPTLLAYQRRVATSDALARALAAGNRPTLSVVGATWGRGSGAASAARPDGTYAIDPGLGAGLPFKVYNYAVGAALTWRLTELIHSHRAATAQLARSEQARADYSQQALQLRTEQQNARLQLELAQQSALAAPAQLDAAQRAYTQAQARYNAGLDNLVVLTQATLVLNRAETDQAIATSNVWRALVLRAATSGDLGEFTSQLP